MFPPVPNPDVQPQQPRFGDKDLIRRSASNVTPPAERQTEVAKLIDVSKCIGCKACQSACAEWNDTHEEVGVNVGVYDNPHDLTANTFTLMRFTEWDNPDTGNLEWLIRKDGCMHCEDPGCLKACPARRNRAIFQWHRRFHPRELHRLRLLHQGLSVRHSAHLAGDEQGL
jgi:formate dehydrogenase iron-sulfur subunit